MDQEEVVKQRGTPANPSRRNFLVFGAGAAVAAAIEIPYLGNSSSQDGRIAALKAELSGLQGQAAQATKLQNQIAEANSQSQTAQTQINAASGFLYLNTEEQVVVESIAETIIPSDSNGPGAKEAGVIYFIDRQLASDYGSSGSMYMRGPFFQTGQQKSLTVKGQTYAHGTPVQRIATGTRYQYPMDLRYFWRYGIEALQDYSTSAYGAPFQSLGGRQKSQVLTDLWNNKPTSFNDIVPVDFAYELFFMVWSGFLTDPLYGGNRGMVGWEYVGFNGTNLGDFYGENKSQLTLATDKTPTKLKPASLAQFQQSNS